MNMNDEKKMYHAIRFLTLCLSIAAMLISLLLFPGSLQTIGSGILIGSITGILGFNMIIKTCNRIDGDSTNLKAGAYNAYLKRYLLYFLVFGISVYQGIEVLSLLIGILLHKAAIVVYSLNDKRGG